LRIHCIYIAYTLRIHCVLCFLIAAYLLRIGCVLVAYFTIHLMCISQDIYVNEKEAYEAYRSYGYNLGFSVRKDHQSYWPNFRNLKTYTDRLFYVSKNAIYFPLLLNNFNPL